MRKILILGGTGTISSPITASLAKDSDVHLTLINRGHHNEHLDPAIEILIGDIRQPGQLEALIQERAFDCVIDFILFDPETAKTRIRQFTDKTKQFIFISTVACLDHEHHLIINEETPRGNRFSQYGQNKAASELVFLKAYEEHGFPVTIVRPSQTYSDHRIPVSVKGKGAWSIIKRMKEGKEVLIHGDGESVWASTHAEDFAKGFIPLINHPQALGEIIQIMNPAPHTWNQVYRDLAEMLGVDFKPVYLPSTWLSQSPHYDFLTSIQGDKMFSCLYDVSKLKRLVPDFEPKISLKEGLRLYLAYMEAHPELKDEEPDFDVWCDTTLAALHDANQTLKAVL